MAKCKCCGGAVWSGVVLHSTCFERMCPVWHPGDETPPTHIETWETDRGDEPFSVSEQLLCELKDGSRVLARYYATDDDQVWISDPNCCVVEVTRWMVIPK